MGVVSSAQQAVCAQVAQADAHVRHSRVFHHTFLLLGAGCPHCDRTKFCHPGKGAL